MSGSDFRIHFRTDFALFALFPRLFSLLFHSSAHQFYIHFYLADFRFWFAKLTRVFALLFR